MSVDNGMITLNIYNKPPQFTDETEQNINQSVQNDYNLNTDKPYVKPKLYDNIKNNIPQNNNINSAPRVKYNNNNNKTAPNVDSSSEDISGPIENHQKNNPIKATPPQYPQYQQYPLYPQYQQPYILQKPMPVTTPGAVPYNMPYGQPMIIQGRQNNNTNNVVNNAPKTIIVKEKRINRNDETEDCCAGCLAGMCSCLAVCCLIGLCCPHHYGPHYGPPHGPHFGPPHGPHGRW